ncbi:MAG TPA: hypothetical protein VGH02_06220 [Rhizomicrobium sp.]
MTETLASAGDGPALENTPARAMLKAGLSACHGMLADCASLAGNADEGANARMLAAQTAAKLAAASALAASAIAKLAEAETHQRLANVKIELALNPHGTARPRAEPEYDGYRAEAEKSTNNLPRVRSV